MRQVFRGNSQAGVSDREQDVVSRRHNRAAVDVFVVKVETGGLDGELPALGHRVTGVYSKIDDDLLHLNRIGLDMTEVLAGDQSKLDVLSNKTRQNAPEVLDHFIEVEQAQGLCLSPAEREKLPGKVGGAARSVQDFANITVQ